MTHNLEMIKLEEIAIEWVDQIFLFYSKQF